MALMSTMGIVVSVPGQTMGVGPFNPYFSEELGLSSDLLSIAYGIGTGVSASLLWLGGILLDRLGSRVMFLGSVFLFGLSLFYMSGLPWVADVFSTALGVIHPLAGPFLAMTLGFFLIRFLGQGMVCLPPRQLMGKWWSRRRGRVMSLTGVGGSFFFAFAPKGLDALIDGQGWQGAYVMMGVFLCVIFAGVVWLLVRDNPESCGLVPDGEIIEETGEPKNQDLLIRRDYTRNEAMKTFAFWAANLALGFHALVFTGYTFHIVAIGQEMGIGEDVLLSLFVPMAVVSVATNLTIGWVSDHTRIKYILFFFTTMMAVCLSGFLVIYSESAWNVLPVEIPGLFTIDFAFSPGTVLVLLGLGTAGGCFGLLSTIVWPRFYGKAHLGAINGVAMSTMVISSAVGPALFAWLHRVGDSYEFVILLSIICSSSLAVASWWADNPQRKLPPPAAV